MAGRGIAHIDETTHGIGGMDESTIFHPQAGLHLSMAGMDVRENSALRRCRCSHATRRLMLFRRKVLLRFRLGRLCDKTGE